MSEKHKLAHDITPDVHQFHAPPENIHDIINGWGTYNIQATSDTENLFPSLARAYPKSGNAEKLQRMIWRRNPDPQSYAVDWKRLNSPKPKNRRHPIKAGSRLLYCLILFGRC